MTHDKFVAGDKMEKSYRQIIKELREDHDYTQEYVAKYFKTSQTVYARYKRGFNQLLSIILSLCANFITFLQITY